MGSWDNSGSKGPLLQPPPSSFGGEERLLKGVSHSDLENFQVWRLHSLLGSPFLGLTVFAVKRFLRSLSPSRSFYKLL